MGLPLLSFIIFTPVAGAAVLMFLRGDDAVRWTALGVTILDLALCIAMLITGDCLFHNGYLSERSDILNTVANDPYVAMSAQDTAELGLSDGDQVIVRSGQGELTAQLKVDRQFPKGLVFVPENYRALRLNSLLRRGEYP